MLSGLRSRLLLLVMVALLPGLALIITSSFEQRRRLERDAREDVAASAQLLAETFRTRVDGAQGLLLGLTSVPEVRDVRVPGCEVVVRRALAKSSEIANIFVLDAHGSVLCSAVPIPWPINAADRGYFKRAVASRGVGVSGFMVSRSARRPTLDIAMALVSDEGKPGGAVGVELDLATFDAYLPPLGLPAGAEALVLDGEGIVLSRWPEARAYRGEASGMREALASAGGAARETLGADGERRLYGIHPVHAGAAGPAMFVAVGVPPEHAYAPATRALRRNLAVYGAIALFAMLGALAVAEWSLVRRIRALIDAARRLSGGDYRARSGLRGGGGELGVLAATFDEMAANLDHLARENRLVLESAGEGLVRLDPRGRVTYVNPAAAKLIARPLRDILGRPVHDVVHGGGEACAAGCTIAASLRDGAVHQGVDRFAVGGQLTPVEFVSTPIVESARIIGAVVAFKDVTERTRLEEQLRQSQKMEAVGQLAGGVAHDFNNLLTAILSFARFVRADLPDGHVSRPDVDEIIAAAERAATLTRQLLAFSRRQVMEPRVIDVGETVRGIEKMLRRIIGEHIELETRIEAAARVRADPGHLEQVVLNLAVNARDAMPRGGRLAIGVRDVAPGAPERSEEGGLPEGPLVALTVADSGTGMDRATLERAFEPFFTTKPPGKGTGLGLSTVYGIVTQSGGAVRVRSAPGEGTRIAVYLPAVQADGADVLTASRGGAPEGPASERVLVVEDDDVLRGIARRALAGAGYAVVEAARPSEAVALAGDGAHLDLLLTDVVLPERSGVDLAAQLVAGRPGLRVLYTSGHTAGHLTDADALGSGSAFLPKPFTPEVLLQRVREVLDGPPGAAPRASARDPSAADA